MDSASPLTGEGWRFESSLVYICIIGPKYPAYRYYYFMSALELDAQKLSMPLVLVQRSVVAA